MRSVRTQMLNRNATGSRRGQAGFTFAEALAALLFMAIVVPVAMEGLSIANRAGVAAERKSVAVRLADSFLNELVATGNWQASSPSGAFGAQWPGYQWLMRKEPWFQQPIQLLSVEVTYPVQNRSYSVRLSTLVCDTNQ
ncbi:MAG: type IV pilus modification PilV family protein [Limisphaerales bacterium]